MKWLCASCLILAACSSSSRTSTEDSCFPVPFDHIFFKVDLKTFKAVGQSSVFSSDDFSFFEPHKKPRGSYEGHYITGQHHYLEILSSNDTFSDKPIGIGFLSEKQGCMDVIQATLEHALPGKFKRIPDESWGSFMDFKTPHVWSWVYESTPAYVGKGQNIDRFNYLRAIRKQNGDLKDAYNFLQFKKIHLSVSREDYEDLAKKFTALGWEKVGPTSFEAKNTQVEFEITNAPASLKSLEIETSKALIAPNSIAIEKLLIEKEGKVFRIQNKDQQTPEKGPRSILRPSKGAGAGKCATGAHFRARASKRAASSAAAKTAVSRCRSGKVCLRRTLSCPSI